MAEPLPAIISSLTATVGDMSRNGDGITRKFVSTIANCEAAWTALSHNTIYELGTTENPIQLYFNRDNSSITRKEAGLAEIALNFIDEAEEKNTSEYRESGDKEYTLTCSRLENPLRMNSAYRMKHDHNLYQLLTDPTASVTVPSWADTATDDSDTIGSNVYKWAKEQPQAQEGQYWKLARARTKTFDVYIAAQSVLTVSTYKADRATAAAALIVPGKLKAPELVPTGFNSGADYWLVTNSQIQKINKKWAVSTEYTYAEDGWDSDYYDEATATV